MKFYSETTKQMYDSVKDLEAAEAAALKEKDARKEAADKVKAAADKVSEAYVAYQDACKEHRKVLTEFCEKYGSYKTTVRANDIRNFDPLSDLLNFSFFNF